MFLDIVAFVIYGLGVPFGIKGTLAWAEGRILRKYPDQARMDSDDWFHAGALALLGGVFWPLVVVGRVLKRPAYAFFAPPVQKRYDKHWTELNQAKQLVLGTADIILECRRAGDIDTSELDRIFEEQKERVFWLTNSRIAEESDALQEFKARLNQKAIT